MDVKSFTPSERDRLQARAWSTVEKAIREGKLGNWRGLSCVDCGAPADGYDHRDYFRPLLVEAVCRACNNRRGPGLPLPTGKDGKANKHDLSGLCKWRWEGLDAGEGYQPLSARLCTDVNLADLEMRFELSAEKREHRMNSLHWLFGRQDIDRYEFFKQHDPWHA